MKILTICYSLTGNNQKLANYLKEKLNCDTFEIKTKKKIGFSTVFMGLVFKKNPKLKEYKINFEIYDKIIFVSPVWFGKLAFPIKSFLLKEKPNILNYCFLTICLGGQKDKLEKELTSILEKKPFYIEEFGFKKPKEEGKLKQFDKLNEKNFEELKKAIDKSLKYLI